MSVCLVPNSLTTNNSAGGATGATPTNNNNNSNTSNKTNGTSSGGGGGGSGEPLPRGDDINLMDREGGDLFSFDKGDIMFGGDVEQEDIEDGDDNTGRCIPSLSSIYANPHHPYLTCNLTLTDLS